MHAPTVVDSLSEEMVDRECPTDLLQALERDSALHRTLAQLAPIHRQLLSLAFFEGLTHTEIAATTHLALGTVKSHLRRALQAIRTVLPQTP
jgi:RNA polymerase sigma-70 factor (ECF subfamily)